MLSSPEFILSNFLKKSYYYIDMGWLQAFLSSRSIKMAAKWSLFVPLIIATMVSIAFGQTTIALCGTVTDASGSPLSGVTIKLQKTGLTALSQGDGTYCIISTAGVARPSADAAIRRNCFIKGKKLVVSLINGDRFAARLFDLRGRTLWEGRETAPVGGIRELTLPLDRIAPQSGMLSVIVGPSHYAFTFARCDRGSFVFCRAKAQSVQNAALSKAAAPEALPILDTLVATGSGYAMNNKIRSYVYTFLDTIDFALGEPDSFSEARQQIYHRINDYRGTLGLKRLIRAKNKEACVDTQSQMDFTSNTAHSAFGHCKESAQNECPGWNGTNVLKIADNIVTSCMQMMWDEGPPPAGTPCGGSTTCYQQHGHYINMTNTAYLKMACGFYCKVSETTVVRDTMWAAQDFF
jgi:hypothetical protein